MPVRCCCSTRSAPPGWTRLLSTALGRWRKPTAVHDPAKILLDVAVSLAVGGDCLADIAALREAPQVFGPVASDPTVSRLIDALAKDAPAALAAIDVARAAARKTVWTRAGEQAPITASIIGRRWWWMSTRRW